MFGATINNIFQFCNYYGGKLVEIMSAEESKEIHLLLENIELVSDYLDYWIGLNDKNIEGEFVWISTGKIANYTNWDVNEPIGFTYTEEIDDDGIILADCVYLVKDKGTWRDTSCDRDKFKALCERGNLTSIY
jgi:hypothetical protein